MGSAFCTATGAQIYLPQVICEHPTRWPSVEYCRNWEGCPSVDPLAKSKSKRCAVFRPPRSGLHTRGGSHQPSPALNTHHSTQSIWPVHFGNEEGDCGETFGSRICQCSNPESSEDPRPMEQHPSAVDKRALRRSVSISPPPTQRTIASATHTHAAVSFER